MIYVFENKTNGVSIVYDETTLTQEEKLRAIALKELPQKEEKYGLIAILKADKSKEKVWYEYVEDTRVKEENEIEKLKQQLAQCQRSITELTALASTMVTPKE